MQSGSVIHCMMQQGAGERKVAFVKDVLTRASAGFESHIVLVRHYRKVILSVDVRLELNDTREQSSVDFA